MWHWEHRAVEFAPAGTVGLPPVSRGVASWHLSHWIPSRTHDPPIPPPARQRRLPPLSQGDLLAVMSAGAYGMSMASNYNSRPRPAEVLVEGAQWRVVRKRESLDDLMRGEST